MSDPGSSTARRMGALMAGASPPASLRRHLEGRARLIASVERMRGSGARLRLAVLATVTVAAATAATAATATLVARRHAPRPLAWRVDGGTVGAQGYVSIPPAAPSAHLVFDDGSDVALAPGSRGRVAGTTPVGAEVVLEQGSARVRVRHRDRTSWTVDAGPYAVRVTGTEFLVAWAADAEVLDVWMRSGRVVVAGPGLDGDLALAAGQHLAAKLRDRTVQIDVSPEPADAPHAQASPPAPSDPTAAPAETAAAQRSALASSSPDASWPKRVAAGDYARVVREADREGVARAIASRPLGDLRALGDAARYAGRPDVAKRAYAAIRARFLSSGEARTAAFLIGRVAEEQEHATGDALTWYDAYLAEAPDGSFAEDALGRTMVIVSTTQGRDAARPVAQRYLRRFPGGPYASVARDLAP